MARFEIDRPSLLGRNGISWLIVFISVILSPANSFADSYAWATVLGGDPPNVYGDNVARNFTWEWSPGQQYITGTAFISRIGAGLSYAGSGYDSSFASAGEFDPTSLSFSYGGVNAEYAFFSDGQLYSGTGGGSSIQDVSDVDPSTTNFVFKFDAGFSSPHHTLLNLVDPGAYTPAVDGPFTYTFSAFLGSAKVDMTQWKLEIEDPYFPSRSTDGLLTWDPQTGTLVYPHDDARPQYPGWMVYLDTGDTTFDTVNLVANGLALDSMAIGIGANTPAIPEPRSLAIGIAGVLSISLCRMGARRTPIG